MVTKPSVRHTSAENLLRVTQSESLDPQNNNSDGKKVKLIPAAASRSVPKSTFDPVLDMAAKANGNGKTIRLPFLKVWANYYGSLP